MHDYHAKGGNGRVPKLRHPFVNRLNSAPLAGPDIFEIRDAAEIGHRNAVKLTAEKIADLHIGDAETRIVVPRNCEILRHGIGPATLPKTHFHAPDRIQIFAVPVFKGIRSAPLGSVRFNHLAALRRSFGIRQAHVGEQIAVQREINRRSPRVGRAVSAFVTPRRGVRSRLRARRIGRERRVRLTSAASAASRQRKDKRQ